MSKDRFMRHAITSQTTSKIILIALVSTLVPVTLPQKANAQDGPQVSLNLSQAIDLALKQNRTLRLASLSVTDTEHKKEVARSAYFPHITNQSGVLHVTDLAGVQIPAGAFGVPATTGAIPARTLFIDQGTHTSYTSGTQLAQPLTQIFKIHESNRAAQADIDIAKIQLTQTEDIIALKVRKLYCDLVVAQLKLQAANEEVSASEVKNHEDMDTVKNGRALDVVALESKAATLEARQAALIQKLAMHDLTLSLNDLLGLPLGSKLQLDPDPAAVAISIPTREECLRMAREQSPSILAARQSVIKAKAGLGAAKDAYIPDVTGLARYSYQSGVPLLVHNFGTFGFNLSYDLFDGGRRSAELKSARTLLDQAQVSLDNAIDEVDVEVESAYDKVEQSQSLVSVIEETVEVRIEAARVVDRQYEQSASLASVRSEAHAKLVSARASLLEATLGLSLAQGDVKRVIGQIPR
jgi:outer membrane protein TolC